MSTTHPPMPAGRRALLRRGTASAVLITLATVGRHAFAADAMVAIDNFTFSPSPLTVVPGTTVTWENRDDIPHAIYCPALNPAFSSARHERHLRSPLRSGWHVRLHLLDPSPHAGPDRRVRLTMRGSRALEETWMGVLACLPDGRATVCFAS